jgi:hypothetical protein
MDEAMNKLVAALIGFYLARSLYSLIPYILSKKAPKK